MNAKPKLIRVDAVCARAFLCLFLCLSVLPGGPVVAKAADPSWSALGSGLTMIEGEVSALAVGPDGLYVGGHFGMAGGVSASSIARWSIPPNKARMILTPILYLLLD